MFAAPPPFFMAFQERPIGISCLAILRLPISLADDQRQMLPSTPDRTLRPNAVNFLTAKASLLRPARNDSACEKAEPLDPDKIGQHHQRTARSNQQWNRSNKIRKNQQCQAAKQRNQALLPFPIDEKPQSDRTEHHTPQQQRRTLHIVPRFSLLARDSLLTDSPSIVVRLCRCFRFAASHQEFQSSWTAGSRVRKNEGTGVQAVYEDFQQRRARATIPQCS